MFIHCRFIRKEKLPHSVRLVLIIITMACAAMLSRLKQASIKTTAATPFIRCDHIVRNHEFNHCIYIVHCTATVFYFVLIIIKKKFILNIKKLAKAFSIIFCSASHKKISFLLKYFQRTLGFSRPQTRQSRIC